MANELINGAGAGMVQPPEAADPNAGKTPTWGYGADGAKLFHLAAGEGLPAGYEDSPTKVAKAEAPPVVMTEPEAADEPAVEGEAPKKRGRPPKPKDETPA
jgi:hypothetical protein